MLFDRELSDIGRGKFIYPLRNNRGILYGTTTDIYMLPIGTEFTVENGIWDGEIVDREGLKFVHVLENGRCFKLESDKDYGLVISIK